VASIYNALILPDAPVYDNKKICKMKNHLKIKFLLSIYVEKLFLLKTILLSEIGMVVKHVFFLTR
jgi:hypothetical protein